MNLKKFNKFKKTGKAQVVTRNKDLWMYTRVSSKEQTKKSIALKGKSIVSKNMLRITATL
ncbi:hypothetical protein LZ575_19900 [Antarcticibacterium sp. 1MA-6-2]|uniref:hypothetical protein n=1 Tax=Antarcticibacterium sp. 1MA-6-2 TaxID=2908210 RepID=UPI001F3C0A9F|nr:hypothetical protein [Antarcticibacterium sp. 1MA-6-2]UJH90926.1 hypothetical protein LZ575_19900 [Antarcticibacterium sp. 1MA-6-2]